MMIKITALNEAPSEADDNDVPMLATQEAQEEEAHSLYNRALEAQKIGRNEEAEELFKQVLKMNFVSKAVPKEDGEEGPLPPGLTLKYLAHKNLATIAAERNDYHASMESYLESINIDSSDVSMWFKMGRVALNLHNYPLARLSFEEGLKCNPNHWPCLDNVITVLYALNDYSNCLYYISRALLKESSYLKGLVLRDQIYKEHAGLRSYCDGFFKECDPSVYSAKYEKELGEKYIQESLAMREKKRELSQPEPLPVLTFAHRLKEYTWKALGESLIGLYEQINNSDPPTSFGCRVDLTRYKEYILKQSEGLLDNEKGISSPATVSSSSEGYSHPDASPASIFVPTSQSSQQHQGLLLPQQQQQQDEQQEQQLSTGESQAEMEVEELPSCVSTSGVSSVYITIPPSEMRIVDGTVYIDPPMGTRRGSKRKKMILDTSELGVKRRSARVRNTTMKKHQENINYKELLQKFLPSSLLGDKRNEDQESDIEMISQEKPNGDHTYGQTVLPNFHEDECPPVQPESFLSSSEKDDVKQFLLNNQNNGGILDLLYQYLIELSSKSNLLWPKELTEVYIDAYTRSRNHFTLPSLFCQDADNEVIKDQGLMTLVYSELKIDRWTVTRGRSSSLSPSLSPKGAPISPASQLGPDFPGKYFLEDLEFLLHLSVRRDILGGDWINYIIRVFWLQARFHMLEGEMEASVSCMDKITDLLQQEEEKIKSSVKILLPNCILSKVITIEHVHEQLESLQRCQSLEEVHRLYEQGNYHSVVNLLVLTFRQPRVKRKASTDGGIPERHAQLLLLQDSLWRLETYDECLCWGEVSFNEALHEYINASIISSKTDWAETMTHLLSGLDRCLRISEDFLNCLEEQKLVRLTHNLIEVISLQMDTSDGVTDMAVPTVLSWILLYRLIHHQETKIHNLALQSSSSCKGNDDENALSAEDQALGTYSKNSGTAADISLGGMPSSLMLLFTAHEYLGRLSCCCASDGALLLLCIDRMMSELKQLTTSSLKPYKMDLEVGLEQCFYCLYGHPNKRTKAKHLQEHNAPQIPLTWDNAVQIFQFFKPNNLPEFDSYRTSTVSAELEYLLRRISQLVPPCEDPTCKVDALTAYIEGGTDRCPSLPPDHPPPSAIVRDLYYLLGDYYFKNKEFGKAIKFYILDICVNPERLDSWAGMALARSSQLEQKLNSCELKNEAAVYRKSASALKCFEHALELDCTNASLWIEYGSLAYMLHSHASRQLKQKTQFGFGDDMLDLLQNKKEEMLAIAERCFQSANRCEANGAEAEEVWLHHYMLGKINEKQRKDPRAYLEHYRLAAHYLHEDKARYPKKITYHNPPDFSIEALEVYYRMHASSLKFLSQYEGKSLSQEYLSFFHQYLKETMDGPFATFQEKAERDSRYTSVSSSEAEECSSLLPIVKKKLKKMISATSDHDYFHGEGGSQMSSEMKSASIADRNHRHSIDSSSESQDSAAIKEVLNSLVTVVAERCSSSCSDVQGPTVVLGDSKIPKLPSHLNIIDMDESKDLLNTITIETLDTALPCFSETCEEIHNSNNVEISEISDQLLLGTTEFEVKEDNLGQSSVMDELLKLERLVEASVQQASIAEASSAQDSLGSQDLENSFEASTPKSKLEVKSYSCVDESLKIDDKEEERPHENDIIAPTKEESPEILLDNLIQQCVSAMHECLQRYQQQYKALYRMAHYYFHSSKNQDLHCSLESLLGTIPVPPNTQYSPSPGLFAERKNTNFFNGIWRVPNNEIDRPGSFGAHMYRSVVLLIDVLSALRDHSMLLHVTVQLHRVPDLGKKYLRDMDRIYLARKAFKKCLDTHRKELNSLLQEEPPPEESRLVSCLLDIYRTWQTLQKANIFPDEANDLLEKAYKMYKIGEVDPFPTVLEQAIIFCQMSLQKLSTQVSKQDGSRSASVSSRQVQNSSETQNEGYLGSSTTAQTASLATNIPEIGQKGMEFSK